LQHEEGRHEYIQPGGAMTDTLAAPVRLLGLPGSLRKNSNCLAVLLGLQTILPETASLEIRDLDLPLYNQDEDGDASPAAVVELRRAATKSDGLVIVTPEYNYGMSGVLKNALDWISRPYGKSSMMGKPALVISVSPATTGGVRAQGQVFMTLLGIGARIPPGPQVVIGNAREKIRDGRLTDEPTLAFARDAVGRLVEEIGMLQTVARLREEPSSRGP
jgi:chromate reductase